MRIALAALVALAACAPVDITVPLPDESAQPVRTEAVDRGNWLLPGTEWRLVELSGRPFPARVVARLTTDGRIEGDAPCNAFNATYTGRWPDLSFDAVASTRRACPELDQEQAFFDAIGKVTRARHEDDRLRFSAPDGTYLVFVRA